MTIPQPFQYRGRQRVLASLILQYLLVFAGLLSAAEPGVPSGTNAGPLSQEAMTPARFREIASAPGDAVPLIAPLAAIPFWTNAVATNVMTYASGKVFTEVATATAHTVRGRYVVFKFYSHYYQRTMNAILGYDVKASAPKTYGLYGDGQGGDVVTEGLVTYDLKHKTYTITSAYGDFKETTTGSYTDTEDVARTVVNKNGALFMTRTVVTRPVTAADVAK